MGHPKYFVMTGSRGVLVTYEDIESDRLTPFFGETGPGVIQVNTVEQYRQAQKQAKGEPVRVAAIARTYAEYCRFCDAGIPASAIISGEDIPEIEIPPARKRYGGRQAG